MYAVTTLYAGVLGVLYGLLTVRVVLMRRNLGVGMGDGGKPALRRILRAHGNFGEYVPLSLLLILLLESQGVPVRYLYFLGTALVVGRMLHAWAFTREDGSVFGRMAGIALTLVVVLGGSVRCLAIAAFGAPLLPF